MATLSSALEDLIPQLHTALVRTARPALPLFLSPHPHALATVPGSLKPFLAVPGSPELPYANALAAVLQGLPPGPNARPARWPTQTAKSPAESDSTSADASDGCPQLLPFNTPLWASKIGGFGFLPKGVPYPMHAKNSTPLQLLMQLNIGELRAQYVAWLETNSNDNTATASEFLPTPLWPDHGMLALYTDPFDDCMGSVFTARCPQDGYRVLFFPDECETSVYPLLQQHAAAVTAGDEAALRAVEEGLAEQIWTREEQYAVFEDAFHKNSDVQKRSSLSFVTAGSTEQMAQLEKEKAALREVMWLLPAGTATPTHISNIDEGIRTQEKAAFPYLQKHYNHILTRPQLWYGQPCDAEYALLVDLPLLGRELAASRALLVEFPSLPRTQLPYMTPANSVEFGQQVLYRALRSAEGPQVANVIYALYERTSKCGYGRWQPPQPPLTAYAETGEGTEASAPLIPDPLEALLTNEVETFDFMKERVAALRTVMTHKTEDSSSKKKADEDEEEEGEDEDDWCDPRDTPVFTNQLGGYPSFTQTDPRIAAYTPLEGGTKDSQAYSHPSQVPGMAIHPEKLRHEVVKQSEASAGMEEGKRDSSTTNTVTFHAQRDPEDGAIIADLCLFQIGQGDKSLMIGDCGIANVFIAEEDLRARRFDRAWFTYDCS